MKTKKILWIGFAIIFAISCKTKAPTTTVVKKDVPNLTSAPTLISNNNQFAFELYHNMSHKPGNLFCSPFSISTALAMTYTGASGNTGKQMAEVMHFGKNGPAFYDDYQSYLASIANLNKDNVSIYSANSLWAQKDFTFRKDFMDGAQKYFSGEVINVNFKKEPEACRKQINTWTEDKTNKKITDLIPSGLITDLTRLVLVNAIYFKAPWQQPFNEKATKKMDFKMDENTIQADFMIADNGYKYYNQDNFSAVEIPYAKSGLSMMIILPKDNSNFDVLKKSLNNELYNKIISGMAMKKVKLMLPKFKITSEFELSQALTDMGMKEAFTDNADFTGMDGKKDLKISKVVHKAFVDVNEAGTEAAAATAVIVVAKSMPVNSIEFKADHPFIFIIKENVSNSILFAGNIYDPTK